MSRARRKRQRKLDERIAASNRAPKRDRIGDRVRARQLGTLGETVAGSTIATARPAALDIQRPGFWRKVWA